MRHRDPHTAAMLRRVVNAVELHARRTERKRRRWPALPLTEQLVRDRLRVLEGRLDPNGPFLPLLSLQLDVALTDAEQLE